MAAWRRSLVCRKCQKRQQSHAELREMPVGIEARAKDA
ncbi:hypothetical protein MPQ_2638 [Methylovorus sp. MP688]|nr:hypothetical protein MPQ_2638 [Methylovorus sp. MP688]